AFGDKLEDKFGVARCLEGILGNDACLLEFSVIIDFTVINERLVACSKGLVGARVEVQDRQAVEAEACVNLAWAPVALEGAGIEAGGDMVRLAVLHGIQGAAETVLINGLTPLQDEEQTAHSSLRGRRLQWWPSKGAVRTGQCVDQESARFLSHRVFL